MAADCSPHVQSRVSAHRLTDKTKGVFMAIVPGTLLGRYEIRSKIGEGGMGEVYLAQDTKLDRKVALKILPAEVASNQDRMRRFVQEAKAAAALNHPNIAHVYEIDEADGRHFIAMEFIDGETLRECIRGGQTDLRKLLRYLQHVAEGLAKSSRCRDRASRSQARQHHDHARWPREDS